MKPGDLVNWKSRATPTGFPVSMGVYELLKRVGTVENFWEIQEVISQKERGRIVRAFVFEEDLLYRKNENGEYEAIPAKLKLVE